METQPVGPGYQESNGALGCCFQTRLTNRSLDIGNEMPLCAWKLSPAYLYGTIQACHTQVTFLQKQDKFLSCLVLQQRILLQSNWIIPCYANVTFILPAELLYCLGMGCQPGQAHNKRCQLQLSWLAVVAWWGLEFDCFWFYATILKSSQPWREDSQEQKIRVSRLEGSFVLYHSCVNKLNSP